MPGNAVCKKTKFQDFSVIKMYAHALNTVSELLDDSMNYREWAYSLLQFTNRVEKQIIVVFTGA